MLWSFINFYTCLFIESNINKLCVFFTLKMMQQLIKYNSLTDAKQHGNSSSTAKVTHVILCVFCLSLHAHTNM